MKIKKTIRVQDIGNELQYLLPSIGEAVETSLDCLSIVETAKAFCPVDTGALQESIRVERRGPHVAALIAGGGGFMNPRTGNEVDYAVLVHDGTSRVPARPFLLEAILMEKMKLAREIVDRTAERI